jgi:hypothetical protein
VKKAGAIWLKTVRNHDLLACFFLAVLFWAARYWLSAGFGLYEDDLTIIPTAAAMRFSEVLQFIWVYITHLYGHARPLSDSFIYLFSNMGWRLGGLRGIYTIGFLITLANILLFYFLIRRVSNPALAFTAAMAYCLYSADTTQAFLTHSLGVQPSITLLLAAAHNYLSKRKWLAYLLSFLILFSYETPFLVFLGVPLLQRKWNGKLLKEFILHGLILGVMLALVYGLRSAIGEGRVSGLSSNDIFSIPFQQVLRGTRVSLTKYLRLAEQTARGLLQNGSELIPILAAFVFLLAGFWGKVRKEIPDGIAASFDQLSIKPGKFHIPGELLQLGQLAIAALVMVAAAYPLTFTTQANVVLGRESRVHLAAVVGNALLMGVLLYAFLILAKRLRLILPACILAAAWLALLVGYGFNIQRDYQKAWQLQREFWRQVVQQVPDAGETTVILVEPSGLQDTVQIDANTWNVPRVLPQLFAMPEGWKTPPRVYRLREHWEDNLAISQTEFRLDDKTVTAPPSLYGTFPSSDIIFLDTRSGSMKRRNDALPIHGAYYELKPVTDPVLPQLPHSLLYSLMFN